jgi:crotonobetainyl-CoA:carnitine CoA-transferase CaiB-like acyl-CoA transferase
MTKLPLDGIRVLDLCIVLAGPTCGKTLAQYGAEVIKIDPEHRPPQLTPWLDVGRGKRSISLNIVTPDGLETFLKLVDSADVILEGFRKGVTDRLGIGYQQLKARNPRLVYASINCFGRSGPWEFRPGFEQNAQAATGVQLRNSGGKGQPRPATFTLNDYGTGIAAAYGIMMALLEREKTGQGQQVEAALSYTSATISGQYHVTHQNYVRNDIGGPGVRGLNALTGLYESSDSWVFLSISSNREWETLCNIEEFSNLGLQEEFLSDDLRSKNDLLLREAFEKIFAANSTTYWIKTMSSIGIPLVKNTTAAEIHSDEFNHERGLIKDNDYTNSMDLNSSWGNTSWAGNPVLMSETPLQDINPPIFGGDTVPILEELGLTTEEIDRLRETGAIPEVLPIKI